MYVVNTNLPVKIANTFNGTYNAIYNKYFVDEAYDSVIVTPIVHGSESLLWKIVDKGLIDGIVNGAGSQAQSIGGLLRRIQSGNIRSYATWVLVASVLLLIALGVGGGVTR